MIKKRTLYLGLEPQGDVVHYPVIRIEPYPVERWLFDSELFTHFLFTSKTAVRCLIDALEGNKELLQSGTVYAVGTGTAAALQEYGITASRVAEKETSEGMVELLDSEDLSEAYVLWPHSALSRCVIPDYLDERGIRLKDIVLYTTVLQRPEPIPDLVQFDEIYFTSPSTVDGFLEIYGSLPQNKILRSIGPITQAALDRAGATHA